MLRRIAAISLATLLVVHIAIFVALLASDQVGPSGLSPVHRPLDATAEDKRATVMGDRLTAIRLIERLTEPTAVVAVPRMSEGFAVLEIGRLYLYPRRLIQAPPETVGETEAEYVLVMEPGRLYHGERLGGAGDTIALYRVRRD